MTLSLERQSLREVKALNAIGNEPRLREFFTIACHGFSQGIPHSRKLWDVSSTSLQSVATRVSEAECHNTLKGFAERIGANRDQIRGILKAMDAPGGISIVHGLPRFGKTTTLVLESLTFAALGFKVLACASEDENISSLCHSFSKEMEKLPDSQRLRVYQADWFAHEAGIPEKSDFILHFLLVAEDIMEETQHTPSLNVGVLRLLEEDVEALEAPENQHLFQREEHKVWYGMLKASEWLKSMRESTSPGDKNTGMPEKILLCRTYEKILNRLISGADIIITTCAAAGNASLYSNFKPILVAVDDSDKIDHGEVSVPMAMYPSVEFRTLFGNQTKLLPERSGLPIQGRQSFSKRMTQYNVPSHALKISYASV